MTSASQSKLGIAEFLSSQSWMWTHHCSWSSRVARLQRPMEFRRVYLRVLRNCCRGHPDAFLGVNAAVLTGYFLVLLNGGAYLPMVPRIIASFGRNILYGVWTQDLYFFAVASAFLVAPWMRQHYDARKALLFCYAIFFLTSALNSWTQNYTVFLDARIVSGLAGGLSIPLSLPLLLRRYRQRTRHYALLIWGLLAVTPFVLGPFLGGWIDDRWGWRWLFLLNLPILLFCFLGIFLWQRPVAKVEKKQMDWWSYALLSSALLLWEMALNLGGKDDWWRSSSIRALAIAGVIIFFVWTLRKIPNRSGALYHFPSIRQSNAIVAALGLFVSAVVFQGLLALFIIHYQLSFHYSARAVGEIFLSMAVPAFFSVALGHCLRGRIDPRFWMGIAMSLLAVSAFWLSSYNLPTTPQSLDQPLALAGLALGGSFAGWTRIGAWGLSATPAEGMMRMLSSLQALGQAMGIPIIIGLWGRRLSLHRHFMVEVQGSNLQAWSRQLSLLSNRLGSLGAEKIFAARVHEQAAMLAFNEMFFLAAWVFLALAFLGLLARRPQPSGESQAETMTAVGLAEP